VPLNVTPRISNECHIADDVCNHVGSAKCLLSIDTQVFRHCHARECTAGAHSCRTIMKTVSYCCRSRPAATTSTQPQLHAGCISVNPVGAREPRSAILFRHWSIANFGDNCNVSKRRHRTSIRDKCRRCHVCHALAAAPGQFSIPAEVSEVRRCGQPRFRAIPGR
jgi:hypothetical protein